MSGDLARDTAHLRVSDVERNRVVAQLSTAVEQGRLTLAEFEQRVGGVLQARTVAELAPYVADLPTPSMLASVPERVELRAKGSDVKRTGRWVVPRQLRLVSVFGTIKLNFVQALIQFPVVRVDVETLAGDVLLVVPRGSVADVNGVDPLLSSLICKVPPPADGPADGPVFVVTGKLKGGSLKIRYERRLGRRRW